jgi:hypothetical protein
MIAVNSTTMLTALQALEGKEEFSRKEPSWQWCRLVEAAFNESH